MFGGVGWAVWLLVVAAGLNALANWQRSTQHKPADTVTEKLHRLNAAVDRACYHQRMTLSEFREQTRAFPCEDVRRAIATALTGRTLRTQQEFSDFYEAVCFSLQHPQSAELVA